MFCCSTSKKKSVQKIIYIYSIKRNISPSNLPPQQQIPGRQNDQIQQFTQATYQVETNPEMHEIVEQLKELTRIGKLDLRIQKEEQIINEFIYDQSMKEEYYLEYQWGKLYTEFLKSRGQKKLRPIDNNSLLKVPAIGKVIISGPQILRTDIKEDDYCLLNQKSWQFVQFMYGGGPEIVHGILDESTKAKDTILQQGLTIKVQLPQTEQKQVPNFLQLDQEVPILICYINQAQNLGFSCRLCEKPYRAYQYCANNHIMELCTECQQEKGCLEVLPDQTICGNPLSEKKYIQSILQGE